MLAKAKKAIPGLIVLTMIMCAGFYLARPRVIYGNPTGEIPLVMPGELGGYKAQKILFCMNDQCARAHLEDDLTSIVDGLAVVAGTCPVCGSELSPISIGEMKLLPDNTPIFRRQYSRPGRPPILVTIVFSGIERRSIHRPQICIVSQGSRILNEYPHHVKTGADSELKIRVLDIQQVYGEAGGQTTASEPYIYAYWLFNPERETDSHWERFLYMAIDNSFRDYRPRWGYVSLSLPRSQSNPDAWKRQLDEFVPFLYPVVSELREELDKQRGITTVIETSSSEMNINQGDVEAKTQNPRQNVQEP